jgi:hypothetical protein
VGHLRVELARDAGKECVEEGLDLGGRGEASDIIRGAEFDLVAGVQGHARIEVGDGTDKQFDGLEFELITTRMR